MVNELRKNWQPLEKTTVQPEVDWDARLRHSEVVVMINQLIERGQTDGTSAKFKDLIPTHWAYNQLIDASTGE